jgi:hypothetical protein
MIAAAAGDRAALCCPLLADLLLAADCVIISKIIAVEVL